MKIRDQIDKFERHKEFSNREFDWTRNQKNALSLLSKDADLDRNETEILRRARDSGLVLYIQNLDSNKQKKRFVPNFLFLETADELEEIEADILNRKKITESKSFEDLIWKVLDLYSDIFQPIMNNLAKNSFGVTKDQVEEIKAGTYAGRKAIKIKFFCPNKLNCTPGEEVNGEGLCSRQNVWKSLFKAVFKRIQPYIPSQKYTFHPQVIEDIEECALCINYEQEDRKGEVLDD